jgi:intracellular multiplication protein IcmK
MKAKLEFYIFFVIFMTLSVPFSFAENTSPNSQALDQLKLLQSKFTQGTEVQLDPNAPKSKNAPLKASDVAAKMRMRAKAISKPNSESKTANTEKGSPMPPPINLPGTENETKIINDLAFASVKNQLFPLDTDKIHSLKHNYHENEFDKAADAGTPPKPTATSQFVNLSPGSIPPVIRLSQGFVSSLVFLDSTGSPWPISAYDLGDPASFDIQWDKTSNTMMIQSKKLYTYGNLAVRLVGLNTPVMLTLVPGQKAVDYRVDLRVQGIGPNASNLPMEEGLPPTANSVLLHVLEGVPPSGSKRLVVNGGDARAWLLNSRMFVRTNLTILSPGWVGSMTSADGMHAYELQKSPVLLVSWHGKVMQLKIEGL